MSLDENPDESYMNKYQKHVACGRYGSKLVCINDKFSKPFTQVKMLFTILLEI